MNTSGSGFNELVPSSSYCDFLFGNYFYLLHMCVHYIFKHNFSHFFSHYLGPPTPLLGSQRPSVARVDEDEEIFGVDLSVKKDEKSLCETVIAVKSAPSKILPGIGLDHYGWLNPKGIEKGLFRKHVYSFSLFWKLLLLILSSICLFLLMNFALFFCFS